MIGRLGRRKATGALAAVVALSALAACGGSSAGSSSKAGGGDTASSSANGGYDTSKPLTIKIGLQALVVQTAYPRMAEALGYFKDENLKVELIQGEATANSVQGLIGGSLDAYLGGPEGLAANEQGADLRFVVGAADASIWDIVTTPDIKTLKDLEGKAIGVSAIQSISTVTMKQALKAKGVDVSKIRYVVAGGTSKRFAALKSGQVQAAPLGVPQNYQAVDEEKLKDFGNTQDLGAPPLDASVLTVSKKWADGHKETLVRFLRAYQRVIDDLYNPAKKDQLSQVIADQLKVDPKYASRAIDDLFLNTSGPHPVAKDGGVNPEALQTAADAFVEFGALKKKVDASQAIDLSYLKMAQDSLKSSPPKSS